MMDLFEYAAEEARARATDPETSHAAAASVKNLRQSQQAVLTQLRQVGPATDEELVNDYERFGWQPCQSPSGLRTRRKELVELGLVEDSGERRPLKSGRMAIVWRAV